MVEGRPMTLHLALPLVALLLNVALIAAALAGGSRRAVDRVFAAFASSMVLWNGGVFWLRAAATADEAFFAEVVIHMGVIASRPSISTLSSRSSTRQAGGGGGCTRATPWRRHSPCST